jgi:hypothetical protein
MHSDSLFTQSQLSFYLFILRGCATSAKSGFAWREDWRKIAEMERAKDGKQCAESLVYMGPAAHTPPP